MNPLILLLLLLSGTLAGVVNSIAGGGAIVVYPLLLALGIPPIVANATMTVTIWPGALSSAYGYKDDLLSLKRRYFLLLIPTALGGLIGAFLLRKTSDHAFEALVPWLFLLGLLLLTLQPLIHKKIYSKTSQNAKTTELIALITVSVLILPLAIYGGYFGVGFGIVMLAILGLTKLTEIRQMNGLKNLAAILVNIIGTVYFTMYGLVDWRFVPVVATGTIIGGYLGATYSKLLPAKLIRFIIIGIGLVVAATLFIKS